LLFSCLASVFSAAQAAEYTNATPATVNFYTGVDLVEGTQSLADTRPGGFVASLRSGAQEPIDAATLHRLSQRMTVSAGALVASAVAEASLDTTGYRPPQTAAAARARAATSPVPLPGAAWLFGSALLAFVSMSNRRTP
jgi:hypothetical protein